MLITAVCPVCETRYQVQAALRGQAMRCPNPKCRIVFTVLDEGDGGSPRRGIPRGPSDPPPKTAIRAGKVGDIVPILPAESAGPQPVEDVLDVAEPAVEAPSWKQPPPVRRPGSQPPLPVAAPPERRITPVKPPPEPEVIPEPEVVPEVEVVPEPVVEPEPAAPVGEVVPADEAPAAPDQPVELPPGAWEPPPVRRGPATPEPDTSEHHDEPAPVVVRAPARGRWTARAIVAASVLLVAGLGVGGYFVWQATRQTEESLAGEARAAYDEGRFANAADKFKQLQELFPNSDRLAEYGYFEELSGVRASLGEPGAPVADGLTRIEEFLKARKGDPLLKQTAPDLGKSLAKLVEGLPTQVKPQAGDAALAVVDRTVQVRDLLKREFKDAVAPEAEAHMDQVLGQVRQTVRLWQRRGEVLAKLDELARNPSADAVSEAVRLVKQEKVVLADLDKDPEVTGRLEQLYAGHRASVVYTRSDEPLKRPDRRDDAVPRVLFDPPVPDTPTPNDDSGGVTLALVRGMLYAQGRGDGAVRWAMRVGIDTTTLPVRVRATRSSPGRILVLSSDAATLTALDADGNRLWTYRLSSPCLGRPVVVDQLAYLPTYDGQVHEIELVLGKLVGRYQLGQRLTVGGARQEGTKRLFFPADDSCVYVLDAGEHRCEAVLYSWHPAGSLRGEPQVVAPVVAGAEGPAYLILNQTAGLDAMQLRVFELPIPGDVAKQAEAAVALSPEPRVRGWTWFPPAQDGEKLVTLSDEGLFGLFGIRQARNRDQALFPWLPEVGSGGISLDPFLKPAARGRGRAQVVQSQGDDFWLLANGKLVRLGLRWQQSVGPKLVQEWDPPLVLGSPLHASQVVQDRRTGRATLFLVTQHLTQQTCLSTAVDDERGRILWQRQLGVVCRGEPLAIPVAGGPPLLLVLDEGGGLFVLDESKFRPDAGADWQTGGQLVAAALDSNPDVPPVLLPAADGKSAYEVACPGDGKQLVVRHVTPTGGARRLKVAGRAVPLPSPLAGTPALVGGWLVFPLANGALARVALPLPPESRPAPVPEEGPEWRSRLAPLEARCHVVAVDGNRFLATDGANGLTVWDWGNRDYHSLPQGAEPATQTPVKERLVAAPLVVKARQGAAPFWVVVADAGGNVTLLSLAANGLLDVRRTWPLGGPITEGPYLAADDAGGVRVGCEVGERKLVWLDPTRAERLWDYETGGPALVGRPRLVGDVLLVADQAGRYVVLDPKTGEKRGPGYTLQGSVAPAASPVTFGAGRAFAPLSDGTALLLPVKTMAGEGE